MDNRILNEYAIAAIITKEEDKELNKAGLQSKMPSEEIINFLLKYNQYKNEFNYKFKKNYEYLKKISEIQLIQINLLSKKNEEKNKIELNPKLKRFCLNCGSRDHKITTCYQKCFMCNKLFCNGFRCGELIELKKYIFQQYRLKINLKGNKVECLLFAIDVIKEWKNEEKNKSLLLKFDCMKRFFKFFLYKEKTIYDKSYEINLNSMTHMTKKRKIKLANEFSNSVNS